MLRLMHALKKGDNSESGRGSLLVVIPAGGLPRVTDHPRGRTGEERDAA